MIEFSFTKDERALRSIAWIPVLPPSGRMAGDLNASPDRGSNPVLEPLRSAGQLAKQIGMAPSNERRVMS